MEDAKSLSFRLESYLVQLADINRRWSLWLAGSEMAAVQQDAQRLQSLESAAAQLFEELSRALADREKLLEDAKQSGLPHSDLSSLARQLPAWQKPALRNSIALARQQLSNLQRLHIATWVLIHQAWQFYSGSIQLLMAGTQPHVYSEERESDTSGGRLLDAHA